ncbi:MAG: hypothetical protein CGU29_04060 [Candidatus Dactylopiibacterium carminicum]|uniref:L-lactate dehydrogenase n=1 Tax=Candidatus Dactylopiibacterium carminicum TaxID=857335 RepID=A0A272EWJ4_9RHOO|nr:malate dehydrogenase [Candidatus Dactylopiibacterium carminicum]KAF7599933.1 hypothetical protein BGI27_04880 [Candidatus Dactylopiibacterium carminicum]PAS94487.1 MAG: hypothetical protein CGU29_04060 [Candidatus Dactylopiibacterium carminicum]PAS99933.1 MAG: hypothetical protein BSR46_04905 [Candidatus Dactylopiibacterium carminicum]
MRSKKIAVVGSGAIGSTVAHSLILRNRDIEVLLVNRSQQKAWAKAFDIGHTLAELEGRSIRAVMPEECEGADVIVMTAGALPREDGTRADVIQDNVAIFRQLVPLLARHNPEACFLNVTNPVDAMAYAIRRLSGFSPGRVLGTGTELDAMRLRAFLAEQYPLEAQRISIDVIGEHGDSMVPVWSRAQHGGTPLEIAIGLFDTAEKEELLTSTRRAGWDIRLAGEHSCYAIAFTATRIVEAMIQASPRPLLVSSLMQGELGIHGVYMSLPTTLGPGGVVQKHLPTLTAEETAQLEHSRAQLALQIAQVEALL